MGIIINDRQRGVKGLCQVPDLLMLYIPTLNQRLTKSLLVANCCFNILWVAHICHCVSSC